MDKKINIIAMTVIAIVAIIGAWTAVSALGEVREVAESVPDVGGLQSTVDRINKFTPPYVYTGSPVSVVLDFENGETFYFGADTGINADMETVINRFYDPSVAFLPIGNFYTMDYKAGAFAASLIDPSDYVIPNHYASFPILEQGPDNFFTELEQYNLSAEPKWMDMGVSENILGVETMWLGHGNWFFESPEGTRILIDPQVEWNMNYPRDTWGDISDFERIDVIILTHGHFDHVTIEDLKLWEEHFDPIIIAPFELGIWIRQYLDSTIIPINIGANISKREIIGYKENILGLEGTNVEEAMANFAEGLSIHFVSASHSSSGTPPEESPQF